MYKDKYLINALKKKVQVHQVPAPSRDVFHFENVLWISSASRFEKLFVPSTWLQSRCTLLNVRPLYRYDRRLFLLENARYPRPKNVIVLFQTTRPIPKTYAGSKSAYKTRCIVLKPSTNLSQPGFSSPSL